MVVDGVEGVRGERPLPSDPGRVVSNYERARAAATEEARGQDGTKGTPTVERTEIDTKERDAARRWLRAELDRHAAAPEESPEAVLAYVAALRTKASELHVDTFEPDLAATEKQARRKAYDARKAELARTQNPFEALLAFAALQKAVPKCEGELEADASAEVARRRAELVTRYQANAPSASDHPGASALRRRLIAVAGTAPERAPSQPLSPEVARAGRLAWQTEASGCEGVERAVSSLSRDGAQPAKLRLAVKCETSAATHKVDHTEKKELSRQEPVYGEKEECTYEQVPSYAPGCIKNLNGQCTRTEKTCKNVSVRP